MKMIFAMAALLASTAASATSFAIQAGHLITDAAQAERGPSTVIVDNGRIGRIESGFTAPLGAIVVDERNRTVMPGMTDAHVHLTFDSGQPWYQGLTQKYSNAYSVTRGLVHALEMAQGGFTTVRDLDADTNSTLAGSDAIAEGAFPGPRIQASGQALSIIGGHNDPATGLAPELARLVEADPGNYFVCTGAEQCSEAVRKHAAAGVDVIKIMATGGVLDPGTRGLEQHLPMKR